MGRGSPIGDVRIDHDWRLATGDTRPPTPDQWTGVRVAEGAGLENRYTRKGIVGSNPTLSVR